MKSAQLKRIARRCGAGAMAMGLVLAASAGAAPDTSPARNPTTQPAAQPIVEDLASIKRCFADLANSDSVVRSTAFTRLMSLHSDALPLLRKTVEESQPLAPAQATVLRQIVTQIFLSGEAYASIPGDGFLGIHMELARLSFGDTTPADRPEASVGMVVTDQIPGFPGARMLRTGDVILSILGRPDISLGTPDGFSNAVRTIGAGAAIHFLILRQGQVIRVSVTLDPRPVDADVWRINAAMADEFRYRRRARADEYWSTHFAALVKEGVS